MKLLKTLLSTLLILESTAFYAQNVSSVEHDVMRTTKKKSFIKDKDGTKTPFRMKVIERRDYRFAFEEEDKGKTDQDRVIMPAYVTKVVYLDNDFDKYYDKYIVIRYKKSYEDKFEIVPTENGLGLKVDEKMVEDISKAGFYVTDTDDNDYFVVEEFRSI
ncbi:hypothetical protein [Aquimarina agarivorans]|uniref:hypothetical protein n=1 Tax=Aquimarina agarivorans TaxID=980584 RepID=UPI000248FAEC|nr:hypothetical protein [Aquimarina agarivorans]